jgi:PKD repeat protein
VFTWTPTEAQGPGDYTFDVVVSDGSLTDSETITVHVNEVNVAPVLGPIGGQTVTAGNLLTFTATATDADIPAQTLTFSLGGAVPAGASITAAGVFTWTPSAAGDYTFDVVVSDGSLTDSETITVHVTGGNIAPIASFTWANSASISNKIDVNAAGSSDPDGTIASYSWSWGDGAVSTGVTSTHTYSVQGDYWVTLTVTDNLGATGTSVQLVKARPTGIPPPPYTVFGYATDSSGAPVYGATATLTDLRTGAVWTYVDTESAGFYQIDLNSNVTGWAVGDTVSVTLTAPGLSGTNTGVAGLAPWDIYLEVDVVLNPTGLSIHVYSGATMAVSALDQAGINEALAKVRA